MFCVIVGKIGFAWSPVDKDLAADGTFADPVETYVNGFGTLLFDGVICKSESGLVVDLHGRGRLGVS